MNVTIRQMSLRNLSLLSAVIAFGLYCFTLAPTFSWGDSADLAMRMVYDGDQLFRGGERDYVFYRFVGKLFQLLPMGDAGTRANLMTAFFGAVSAGLVTFLTGILTRSNLAALGAALALTVSHTFWLMSVIAEVYTFSAALMLATFSCTALWWQTHGARAFYAAAFFTGLMLLHHPTGLVLGATIAPLVIARVRTLGLARLSLAMLIAVVASLPYWQNVLLRAQAGRQWLDALGLSSPGNPFFSVSPLHELAEFIACASYNFIGIAAPLALYGIVQLIRHRTWEMLPPILWMLLFIYAGVTSSIPDKFNIYVLVYPILAITAGIGIAAIEPRYLLNNTRAALLLSVLCIVPPLGYLAALHAAKQGHLNLVHARVMPYRDNDRYFLWPSKRGDLGPRRFAVDEYASLAPNAVLIADYSLWRPLYLLQAVEHMRPDITLVWAEPLTWNGSSISNYITNLSCQTPVYLATDTPPEYYQLEELRRRFGLKQSGLAVEVLRPCRTTHTNKKP